ETDPLAKYLDTHMGADIHGGLAVGPFFLPQRLRSTTSINAAAGLDVDSNRNDLGWLYHCVDRGDGRELPPPARCEREAPRPRSGSWRSAGNVRCAAAVLSCSASVHSHVL